MTLNGEKPEKVEKRPFFTHGIITLNHSESGLTSQLRFVIYLDHKSLSCTS